MKKQLILIIAFLAFSLSSFAGNAQIQKDNETLLLITDNFWLANSLQNNTKILAYQKEESENGTQYMLYFRNDDGGITEALIQTKIKIYNQNEIAKK